MILADDNVSLDGALAYYFECLDRGEVVDEACLVSKFPQHAVELTSFFADQRRLDAKVRELRSSGAASNRLSIRCPNCHQPTEVAVDATLTDIECSACSSHFSLVNQASTPMASSSMLKMGRFQLLERLGMGAYGSVWKARDDELDRIVALKIPRQGGMTSEEQEKFLREARAAAQLRHPNIVSLHEVGREGGSVYIVSDFVHGMTLGDWLTGHQITAREAAQLGVSIADALHHAHEHGVVHRDLKPANIIIDVDGEPHLMDFGLARRDAGEVTVTMDGEVLGTPAYMSPEQAEGKAHAADRRSDVYSLGVILFQFLTGELPFRGNARMLINQVIHDEPPSPRKLNANIKRDLETIVIKAMEKRPADRYASAYELANDLRCYLANKPIKAKPASYGEKVFKWSRRHRTIVSVVGTASVLLLVVLAASFLLINRERVAALAALEETSDLLYTADITAAYDAWDQGWSDEAQSILGRHVPKGGRPDRRGLEWFLLDRLTRPPEPTVLAGHAGSVNEIAVFPGGRRLASVGDDGTLRIWDLKSNTADTIPLGNAPLHSVAVSPDGRYVAAGSKTVYLCDLQERSTPRQLLHRENNFESLAFSNDGQRLAVGERYDSVCLLSLEGELINRVPCISRVESLEFTTDESQLLVPNPRVRSNGTQRGAVQQWLGDLSKKEQEYVFAGTSMVNCARLSPCGRFIAATELYRSRLLVIERSSGRIVLQLRPHRDWLTSLAYSPDGGTIGVAHGNGVFQYLHVSPIQDQLMTLGPRGAIAAHQGKVSDLEFIEEDLLVTCGADGLVKIWNLSRTRPRSVAHIQSSLTGIGWSPDGALLASVFGTDLKLFDRDGAVVAEPERNGESRCVAWSPTGDRFATCVDERDEVVVRDRSGEPVLTIAHERAPQSVAFSPDGQLLGVLGRSMLKLHRAVDGGEVFQRALPVEGGFALAFSPDSRHLAYGGRFEAIVLADGSAKHVRHELPVVSDTFVLAFSADGSLLASGHRDSVVRVWDTKNGKLKAELAKHDRTVKYLAFSPDGRTLLTAADDGTLRVWSVDHSCEYGIAHRAHRDQYLDSETAVGDREVGLSLSSDGRCLAIPYKNILGARMMDLLDLQASAAD